jgi:Ca-activated chloride channel family protein
MSLPTIELLPLRPAVRSDGPVTLDVLVRILPAAVNSATAARPPLNLALVLDRSGSMAGQKLAFACQAATYVVEQLLPADRVSVTVFDDQVQTIVPSTLAEHKAPILQRINSIHPGGTTALHPGWMQGTRQVGAHLVPGGINRVLLLTDGLANVGETMPDAIASDVKAQSLKGVSTTTLGVGRDYNEDLLEAMARSGDGNYYFIETPRSLPDIFQTELRGLMATVGHSLRLGLEAGAGVTVADVLNDLSRDPEGRLMLPNLLVGVPLEVVLRLNVEARQDERPLLAVHLTWTDPREGNRYQSAVLHLPAVARQDWGALANEAVVQERVALQLVGRHKREATRFLERGDLEQGRAWLARAREALAGLAHTPEIEREFADLNAVEQRIGEGDYATGTKMAKYQHYQRSQSRTELT